MTPETIKDNMNGMDYACPITQDLGYDVDYCDSFGVGKGCMYRDECKPYIKAKEMI